MKTKILADCQICISVPLWYDMRNYFQQLMKTLNIFFSEILYANLVTYYNGGWTE